jgi:shikimate kinase
MGSGKSTLGRLVAGEIGYRFLDLDDLIEKRSGKAISEIFRTEGEERFRTLETSCLADLQTQKRLVAALGGGAPIRPENQLLLQDHFRTVYLEISYDTFRLRTGRDTTRPLLLKSEQELLAVYNERLPVYRRLGITIPCDQQSPLELVEEILQEL